MPETSSRGPRRLAALLTGVQALVLAGFAAFYVYELATGEGSDTARVLMSALLILVGAACLGALARGWLRETTWPRTPTIVWDLLLIPVGIGLIQGQRALVGGMVIAVALVTGLAALAVTADDRPLPGADTPD
ncbi:MAG TPA: hypothetical protein VFN34_05195 [Ornithinibacter sp.]|nr:hypothetical protein [Ornithinibacter sp.]